MSQDKNTFASGTNAAYIESMYEDYRKDPSSLDDSWQKFFEGYEFGLTAVVEPTGERREDAKVEAYINAYRRLGYLAAYLNPLDPKPEIPENLHVTSHELDHVDANRKFLTANFGTGEMTFAEITKKLQETYCGSIGPDFRDSNNVEEVVWLQQIMEAHNNKPSVSAESKKRILQKLGEAEALEHFLQTRYLGQKRFSVEGLDALIPLLDGMIDEAVNVGVHEITMGMAHRGRLNVLTHILKKPYERLLLEFEGQVFNSFDIEGDVKYHMGYAHDVETFSGKKVRIYLSPNPSHLEAINAPIAGFTRARQEHDEGSSEGILPIILHGDAAIIGQGVVAEVLNLSQLQHYGTGGTIHIITNNQIGFTTNPSAAKSCAFSSDISKMIRMPVLHVNADDPEAVAWVTKIAIAYRHKFKKDILIDLVGYRRYGHNETDEPSFTQPIMYKKIAEHPTVFQIYSKKLIAEGVVTEEESASYLSSVKELLNEAQKSVHTKGFVAHPTPAPAAFKDILAYRKPDRNEVMASVITHVSEAKLKELAQEILNIDKTFTPHPKIIRLLENRAKMMEGAGAVDWGFAELLAFASLADQKYPVRLSGQDCKRGTFSSRHAVLFDYETGKANELLQKKNWAPVNVINSPLSELGCMGFEFGYSVGNPNTLVLWEAQYGDFVNGAQILMDQFLVASEAKWQQTSGLVLLLPHGHEGAGPEHTSARPERFLQSCGNLNIQVCNVTTPAQMFHLLRRQILRNFRKPLVLMSPKSLLRHPKVISELKDFTSTTFKEFLDDTDLKSGSKAERLMMCTGKIYYELTELREKNPDFAHVPILRLEQLYPFPYEGLSELFQARYPQVREVIWVQEEPQNMGAWTFVRARIPRISDTIHKVDYVGRKNSGSTAEGSAKAHTAEQKRILEEAFALATAKTPQRLARK